MDIHVFPMKRRLIFLLALSAALCGGCLSVKVEPIHMTLDVNVKVDRALDDFFGDLDQKSSTLNTPKS